MSIGRGPTLAVAREAALKLKETCRIHAEAFSGAEFQHGPIALVERGYPAILFMPTDAAAEGLKTLAMAADRKGRDGVHDRIALRRLQTLYRRLSRITRMRMPSASFKPSMDWLFRSPNVAATTLIGRRTCKR